MTPSSRLRELAYKVLHERNALQRFISRKAFRLLESFGFHLVGDHFYEPIPNLRDLERRYRDVPRLAMGIDFRLPQAEALAVDLLDMWAEHFADSAARFGYREENYYFRGVDAVILYCLIREQKPRQVAEIGQGFSTRVIMAALADNSLTTGESSSLVSIDPYNRLGEVDKLAQQTEFISVGKPLQALRPSEIQMLLDSDLLFVDSSHVYKFGSDVEFLFEHVYPALRAGSLVHVHDVYSPFGYPLDWYQSARFWDEAHHLGNFLRFNDQFEVVLPINYLVRTSEGFRSACERTCRHRAFRIRGSSFYFKRVGKDD